MLKVNRTYHPRGRLVDGYRVTEHPLYITWADMLSRCTNPRDPNYPRYGGRGITVCPDWFHFENFARDMGEKPSKDLTLERVINELGYSKVNCTWATRTEQCVNRRKFKNNTVGATGVIRLRGDAYHARFDYEHERFNIGRFRTLAEAIEAREIFITLFRRDPDAARSRAMSEKLSLASSTKVRGVNPHLDGGFTARATVNGVRHYLGYFQTLGEAEDARREFLAKNHS